MDMKKLLIKDEKEYYDMFNLVSKVFNLDQELPGQVFKANFQDFHFEEFDWALSGEFWDVIQTLAKKQMIATLS